MNLAKYLRQRSKEICSDNQCNDEHNCESYAYINENGALLDICTPDYFQGSESRYANISLPWNGNQKELDAAIQESLDENYDEETDL